MNHLIWRIKVIDCVNLRVIKFYLGGLKYLKLYRSLFIFVK